MEKTIAYLGLGSNIGDRSFYINEAILKIKNLGRVIDVSPYYETSPEGFTADQDFINCCLSLETTLSAFDLLNNLRTIEIELGRKEKSKNGTYKSRTIDLDILLFGEEIIFGKTLTIPHPEMHKREFVLRPLNDIAAEKRHPLLKMKIRDLLKSCYSPR